MTDYITELALRACEHFSFFLSSSLSFPFFFYEMPILVHSYGFNVHHRSFFRLNRTVENYKVLTAIYGESRDRIVASGLSRPNEKLNFQRCIAQPRVEKRDEKLAVRKNAKSLTTIAKNKISVGEIFAQHQNALTLCLRFVEQFCTTL